MNPTFLLFLPLVFGTTPDWHIENDFIGPSIRLPDGREVNALAHYWTDVVGLPFDRDVELDVPATPLDLDLDHKVDTVFSGHWSLRGGILKNPRMVGLTPTPDDPAGTVGATSISTGFLGVRQEMDPTTKRGTGRYAVNCWHCHGSAGEQGHIVLGRPNANIHLGLMMAASRVMDPAWVIRERPDGPPMSPHELAKRENLDDSFRLDGDGDGKVTIVEWREALRMPPASWARAMLLLAGPGRLDQSIDFRMDGTIPLANLQQVNLQRAGQKTFLELARRPKISVFNPVSLPQNLSGLGVAHYSWSGKDSSMRYDEVGLVCERMMCSPDDVARAIGFSYAGDNVDSEALSRALTLDFRNVGTFGTEADSVEAMTWSHHVLAGASAAVLHDTPSKYGTARLRDYLLGARTPSSAPASRDSLVERGREIFTQRETGTILNERVVLGREALRPHSYEGIPVLAPLDRSKPLSARIGVRCASCHNYSPLHEVKRIATPLEVFQRCDHCHFDHPSTLHDEDIHPHFISLSDHIHQQNLKSIDECVKCHPSHPDFGVQAYSKSWLLPFDANTNGVTHGDELADTAAGGIGTDACLNLESLFALQLRPRDKRPEKMYLLSDNAKSIPTNLTFSAAGSGWVRVAPLILIGQTAPYLHNGSVPSLEALLDAPANRPSRFEAGLREQHFTFDATLPGNRNTGHVFGTELSREDKAALIAYLKNIQ